MKKKKNFSNIYFFTGKRGGFSHFVPIIEKLKKQRQIKYKIIATDMHLSNIFGKTIEEIKIYEKKIITLKSKKIKDTVENRLSVITNTINELSKIFKKKKPNYLIILGDRAEVLGAAISAMHFNVPIIHLYGGDLTQGGTDEPTRHALTKLSNIHLASNTNSYNNIKNLGEESWRIKNIGLASLDLFKKKYFKSIQYLEKKYKIDFKKPLVILIQHSVTWQVSETRTQIRETLKALDDLKVQTIAIYPCSDPGYEQIIKEYNLYKKKNFFQVYKNIPINDFYSLIKYCSLLIGNSSCGITECGYLRTKVINIGSRQQGRICGKNVFHVTHNQKKISSLIKKTLRLPKIQFKNYIYGNGQSAIKIIKILKQTLDQKKLINKKFINYN